MSKKLSFVIIPILLFVLYLSLSSSSGGINGVSVSGCTCHGAANVNTLVTITGLPAGGYTNGTVYPITVTVTNTTFAGAAGFDLTASSGAFTAITGTGLNGATEIRHSTPKARVAGSASWTFNWAAPPSGGANITFSLAGNAVNSNGNTSGDAWNTTSTVLFKAGAVLSVNATAPNITCNGGVSTITAAGSGPTPPYMYSRNGGAFQTGTTFTSNLAGTYTITVRDATLATATTAVTITQPALIVPTLTSGTILCNGGITTLTASATGGTGAINYSLNGSAFQSSSTFTNRTAGSYTVTARDANFCTKTSTLVVSQPTLNTFQAPTLSPPACNGANTGSISITSTGGTGAKTYSITPLGPQVNASGTFSNLTAQTYTITVTDGNNCTRTTVTTLTQPSALNFNTPTIVEPTCNGGTNGAIAITSMGGTGAKSYSIDPLGPQTNGTGNFTNLSAQQYTISVSDANNCTKTSLITVTEPSALTFASPTMVQPTCVGVNDGSITINASGGTGTKNYSIDPLGPQTNATGNFNNLTAQQYTVSVSDANNCSTITTVSIVSPVCGSTINLKLYLQGYYIGAGSLASTLFNQNVSTSTSLCDSITVELHASTSPYVLIDSKVAALNTDGTATCSFSYSGNYYIAIKHRNTLQTWSAMPVNLIPITSYDFSTAASKAYGDKMVMVDPSVWALYSGDVVSDDNIDLIDLAAVDADISNFLAGYYATDINGDGNVDLLDGAPVELNVNEFIFASLPE